LSIPACTVGKHSTTDKPPPVEKKQVDNSEAPVVSKPPAAASEVARAPVAAPQSTATPPPPPPESESDDPSLEIPKGKQCRRKACGLPYTGGARDDEICVFHPGVPIFHEGSKGYTCCKRRVLEFDEFMRIEGCETKNRHLFIGSGKKSGKKGGEEVLETVRYVQNAMVIVLYLNFLLTYFLYFRHDFYQTPSSVIASFFLKKINKETAQVEFSSSELSVDLTTTDSAPKRYKSAIPLFGTIDPATSTFKILGTKLEVNFVKADGSSWPVLRSDERVTGEIFQVGKAGRA
jgi:hypothetical protein